MALCAACGADNEGGKKFCGDCGAPLAAVEGHRQRKTVTVVFCDVVGSTALGESRDPEALELLLARYFVRMKAIVEAHGGTVEKFIGDAVVAVFGVPVVHEDDALRALRAAAEMRDSLPELEVEARLGVNTGEIVTSGHGTLVTGDAVNVAARLQQAAGSGEILVGADTLALASDAVSAQEVPPLDLKGKAEPVAAFRLISVGEAPERSHGARFVGRGEELVLLRQAWDRAVEGRRCELVTVVGEPGVGKSRLVAELEAGLDVRVVRGRCLSYGEGITYFPVVEVVKQLDAVPADAAVGSAIGSLLGESDAATSPDEIAWAFRKLLEQCAPVVVVFDDIQWGEETFLDLVDHVALLSSGSSLLLLCVARPELSERRPAWPVALRLDPLPPSDVEELVPASLSAALRERIVHAAGGNPLFVTEMVAMAADAGEEVMVVPPTLKALLAARLDRLETAERGVLERGSVEGELFHRGAVQALEPADTQVSPRLMALVRKELIRPDRPMLPAEDGFRFCHLLIRDTAYDALPKATRAELHERFADWLEQHAPDLVERDELVGYHLQQAHRYRTELGNPDDTTRVLGERAAGHLARAGRRAVTRADHHSTVNLLERALSLGIADPHERVQLQVELGNALLESGRVAEGRAALDSVRVAAADLGERGLAALALVYRFGLLGEPQVDFEQVQAASEDAAETFRGLGDERGLALAERLLGLALNGMGRRKEGMAALERALLHAQTCGDRATQRRAVGTLLNLLADGPTPAGEAIGRCEEWLASTQSDRVFEAVIKRYLGLFYAMAARPEEALELVGESSLVLDELNQLIASALFRVAAARAKELAGDRAGAEHELLARWSYFREHDARGVYTIQCAQNLASFYCDEGRWDDAERFAALFRNVPLSGRDTLLAATGRLAIEARLAAHRGELAEAVALAKQAIADSKTLDRPNDEASMWTALAEVQRAAGQAAESDAAVAAALKLYERKGNLAAAARLRSTAVDAD